MKAENLAEEHFDYVPPEAGAGLAVQTDNPGAPVRRHNFMLVNLTGFTGMPPALSREDVTGIQRTFHSLIDSSIALNRGTIIKNVGYAYLITFNSSQDVLQAALRIQSDITSYNEKNPANCLDIKLAINTDEPAVSEQRDDAYHRALNFIGKVEKILAEREGTNGSARKAELLSDRDHRAETVKPPHRAQPPHRKKEPSPAPFPPDPERTLTESDPLPSARLTGRTRQILAGLLLAAAIGTYAVMARFPAPRNGKDEAAKDPAKAAPVSEPGAGTGGFPAQAPAFERMPIAGVFNQLTGREAPEPFFPPQGLLLDDFGSNDWVSSEAPGATVGLSPVPGREGQALRMDYDLGNGGRKLWVQIKKDFAISNPRGKTLQFFLKTSGRKANDLELKLVDADGTNYGAKISIPPDRPWEKLEVDLDGLAYWWGGDPHLDGVSQIYFALSAGEGGQGSISIDELTLKPSAKKSGAKPATGILDSCDGIEGWKIESEKGPANIVSVPGVRNRAIGFAYDPSLGNWVQIHKSFPFVLRDRSVIRFFFKWSGEPNRFEFKLADNDGSTFGWTFAALQGPDQWQEIEIPVKDLVYLWGGDASLDLDRIQGVWISASRTRSGPSFYAIDQLSLAVR